MAGLSLVQEGLRLRPRRCTRREPGARQAARPLSPPGGDRTHSFSTPVRWDTGKESETNFEGSFFLIFGASYWEEVGGEGWSVLRSPEG